MARTTVPVLPRPIPQPLLRRQLDAGLMSVDRWNL